MDYTDKNILAIDCSSSEMKLGLQFGGDRLVKSSIRAEQTHSAEIIKGISSLLDSANCKKSELDAIVVSTGPGSFTGLRIAIACAKGMAIALGIPVVGVNLFEVAAYKLAGETEKIQVLLPFKKNAFFAAELSRGEIIESEITAVTAEEINDKSNCSPVAIIADAGQSELLEDRDKILESSKTEYDATELIYLGIQKLSRNEIPDLAKLEPMYIQKSQAEIKFEERQNRKS